MIITVERIYSDKQATLSIISVDGKFMCFGLEDEFRTVKVKGETRIPAGLYNIKVRKEGGFHTRYKEKFSDFHKGMLHVLDVPGFEYILLHIGNFETNTEGCLLVGKNATTVGTPTVLASTQAYKELYEHVIQKALEGKVKIHYIDSDL